MTREADRLDGAAVGGNARFGIAPLDDLLHGLYWGENVFWGLAEDGPAADDLVAGVLGAAGRTESFRRRLRVTPSGDGPPAEGFDPVPFRPGGAEDLFDALTAAADLTVGVAVAIDLRPLRAASPDASFERDIARLARFTLRRGAVIHWFDSLTEEGSGLQTLAQCVLEARSGQLRIERADGRGPEVRGAMLPYRVTPGGELVAEATTAASMLGRGLRAVRRQRGWTQAHLAAMVGVSGSAISQAERGQHALSLETVVDLAAKLGLSVDHLLRGLPPPYELSRADDVGRPGQAHHLVDSDALRLRTVGIRIPPRGAASPIFRREYPQTLLVGAGLVQVILPSARPILRQGDALTVHSGGVHSCRNLGDDEALVFWQEHG